MEVIHIVLGKANPNRLNGVNKVVYNMATEQVKAGKYVQVWGITPNPVHDYPVRNFTTLLFQAEKVPFFIHATLKKAILAHKTAVFHLHGGWVPVFSTLAKLLAKQQSKFVLTPHGAYNTVAMQRSSWQKKIYYHLFERSILKHVHKVHSVGASEVAGLSKLYPEVESFLLPYGFEPSQYSNERSKNEKFTIGFVGRLDVHTKGLDLLLKAFGSFQECHSSSELWIIGEGEGKGYLEKTIEEGNIQNVVFWGKKFGKEKEMLISKMHVFAHPSRNEGLPTAVLEAAAQGTPSLVSFATNLAEYVSLYRAGIAVDNGQVSGLLDGMRELHNAYQNGTAQDFVLGAQQMLDNVFSWPLLVEKYEDLYK